MSPISLPTPKAGQQVAWVAPPPGAALALALAEAARSLSAPVLAITADTPAAHALEADLAVFAGDLPVTQFPDWEILPYDLFAPHPDIVSRRIAAMNALPRLRHGIVVVPVSTLIQRLPPRRYVHGRTLQVQTGDRLDLAAEQERLVHAGYRHVPQVTEPGEFAVRGALLDIFAMGQATPVRIELFDDTVDSIRGFDPETQRSTDRIERLELLPGREYPLDEQARKDFRDAFFDRFPEADPRRVELLVDLKDGLTPAGLESWLPLFFDSTETLFDYLPDDTLLVLAGDIPTAAARVVHQAQVRYDNRAHDLVRPILRPDELLLGEEALRQQLNRHARVELAAEDRPHRSTLAVSTAPPLPAATRGEAPGGPLASFLRSHADQPVLLAVDSTGRKEALAEQLREHGIDCDAPADWADVVARVSQAEGGARRPMIAPLPLSGGFTLHSPALVVLSDAELAGERARPGQRRRGSTTRDPETILRDLTDLAIGAPVVHEDHGVGRYQGLVTLEAGGMPNEYLAIEYAGGDKLYVPVASLHLVSRYTGGSSETAPLHTLGSEQWSKAKRKAAEKIRDVAAELLEIQARRAARSGEPVQPDRTMYEQFAAGFPFEPTPDQAVAINAVLNDLAQPRPMDRVICGDVGFGKTEVALRAAFATAIAGKQVALLVPTTLLAEQHYRNFRDRFADWPVKIELLSRFRSAKEVNAALKSVAEGKTDIVIGTHRLLSPDVKFDRLGLVIVDEEQRFGVRQKERLKALRAEVHLLTLTATPIPRTLNMAMTGLRDLSIIATPPKARVAVQTLVTQWDPALIREAFARELGRGGQVYFLHNDVSTIEKQARELAELVPEARVQIAHGQMPERELERVMADFYRQRFNTLVASTIIESGIDVPTANTILINRADTFGLSQLHQLRGRVGRSHHRAFAYLLVPERKAMTADAEKRLEAIASLEELGAGFMLATHDLEIRGAGELLGEEQSGQIEAIGFSLYTELLERAVRAIRSGKVPDLDDTSHHGAEVELHLPALIPDDYLPDVHTRLMLYKRIATCADNDALRAMQVEMIDRFGLLPDQVRNLFAVTALKLRATILGVRKLEFGENGGRVIFNPQPGFDPLNLIRMVQAEPKTYAFDGQDKLRIKAALPAPAQRIAAARVLLGRLHGGDAVDLVS
ncbi:transcription-repair coupling factor [Pseudofulvimonas gallinarii]|uniref:Transcription-repair-coupling factor n=1 Tax=Pseudofulvimonas gallinarii TaxID=634155 RepID=A0A4R3LJF2_9GAMM|nr:transcription-repair coupling factor [Pseudofulvimonas gallinarii]TCS99608.1 transcription-repair coupling factor [Pseudofulvimonas gallinarii]THD14822.1 transcription-repair coupling factor [Pseudofulvimonas gallinarii]